MEGKLKNKTRINTITFVNTLKYVASEPRRAGGSV